MKGRLGNYDIIEKLGEGGMGEVWRARDDRLNRSVAVKILPPEVASDPQRRARFEQEARALGALNHPNIVSVYDSGQDNGQAYIVSELVEGESLRAGIARGRLSVRKVLDIAVQIADALAAAHAAGIIHRDLKPENIMMTRDGRAKVLDFGLAKQSMMTRGDDAATLALSQPGVVLGTVGYMSPEQVRGDTVDQRSDIFSFGCVLYELMTGKRAFQAPTSVETMNAVLHEDPPDIAGDASAAPPALVAIVRRCLEKNPAQRFHSAADLAFALRSIAVSSGSGVHAAIAEPKQLRRRAAWLRPAAAIVAAAILFAGGFYLRGRTGKGPPSFQRITFRRGLVTNARFTSDGHNVVYSADWEGSPGRIYLAVPGNPEARDLGAPDNSVLLSVSSHDDIAFLTSPFGGAGSGTLAQTSVSGGLMRPALEGVMCADWAPDGSMAVMRLVDGRVRLEYPIGHVLVAEVQSPVHAVRISADGNYVAYPHFYRNNEVGITLVDRNGKSRFLGGVSGETPSIIDPVLSWTPDGREIWFRSFDVREWGTVYAVDLAGRRRVVARFPGHVTVYDIARDGRMLIRTDTRQTGILGMRFGDPMEKDLSCLDQAILNGISEDGSTVAATIIGESGGPKGSIYIRKTDGSPPVRLGDGAALALSPDAKWVAAYTEANGSRRYVLLPTGAGEEREIAIPELKGADLVYGWSQDDETLFVHGPDAHNGLRNYVWDMRSKKLRPFGPEGVADDLPLVAPDRQQILERGPDRRWWVYPIDGGPGRALEGLGPQQHPIGWRDDSRSLYVLTHEGRTTLAVSTYDIASGRLTPWKEIHPSRPVDNAGGLQITPDGKAYAYNYLLKLSDLYVASGYK